MRLHDAIGEHMRRLLASGLPRRAGQPVKALVHIYFAELREMDQASALQDKWIEEYRAWWAAHRAAASVSTGDGGAGLEGDVARQVVCDAMTVPVVILRDRRHRPLRGRGPDRRVRPVPSDPRRGRRRPLRRRRGTIGPARRRRRSGGAGRGHRAERRSRPGGRSCWPCWSTRSWPTSSRSCPAPAGGLVTAPEPARQGPEWPSLPLDVGQTDDIRIHLRRLVALRDQTCQFPGGYFL
jgi:hypothetical protein